MPVCKAVEGHAAVTKDNETIYHETQKVNIVPE